MNAPVSPSPTRRERRRTSRRTSRRHQVVRALLAGLVAVVVVVLGWQVGRHDAPAPAPAADSGPASPTVTALPTYATDSAAGTIAPGFPRTTVPVDHGATVVSSSAQPVGDGSHVQVSLGLRTGRSAKDVVASYARVWKKAGFEQASTTPVPGADAGATFRRPEPAATSKEKVGGVRLTDYLVIAVVEADGAQLVTITGQVPTDH